MYIYISVWSDAWSCLGRDIQDYDELPLCLCSSSRISRSSHSSSAFRRSDNAKEEVEVCIAAWPLFLPIPSPRNPTKSSRIKQAWGAVPTLSTDFLKPKSKALSKRDPD